MGEYMKTFSDEKQQKRREKRVNNKYTTRVSRTGDGGGGRAGGRWERKKKHGEEHKLFSARYFLHIFIFHFLLACSLDRLFAEHRHSTAERSLKNRKRKEYFFVKNFSIQYFLVWALICGRGSEYCCTFREIKDLIKEQVFLALENIPHSEKNLVVDRKISWKKVHIKAGQVSELAWSFPL